MQRHQVGPRLPASQVPVKDPLDPPSASCLTLFCVAVHCSCFREACLMSLILVSLGLCYSDVHDQLQPPLLASAARFQIRYAYLISPDCHQLYVVTVANGCGYTQGPFWLRIALVGQKNQIEDVRFLFSPFSPLITPPLWTPKREYNAVSAERSMKFSNTVRVETSRYLTKTTTCGGRPIAARFLQPSIRLRYNYYVQGGNTNCSDAPLLVWRGK